VKEPEILLLTRSDVAALLGLEECIAAVEHAFRLHGEGRTEPPGVLGHHTCDGGFHIKAASLELGRKYFVAKTNGNFSRNPERFGLPAIQGLVLLCDAERGSPLALMDSIEITILRTGAATAVAAKHLARSDARVATICGCGNQGRIQLRSLLATRPLKRVLAWDIDPERSRRFATELSAELNLAVEPAGVVGAAVRQSDICVTCTPSRKFFLRARDVAPGTFVAAVGADSVDKQELEPELLARAKLVVDILEQCATIGELHHALEKGCMARSGVYAELGEIAGGRKPGRTSREEITIFDSTGTALQDVAAAAIVYEKALAQGRGTRLDLAA
jgi:alanine dehydrogenase